MIYPESNRPRSTRRLILFEDTHSLKISKSEKIISNKGRFKIIGSKVLHPSQNDYSASIPCKSLDTLAFIFAIDSISFSDGEYEVKGLNNWLQEGIDGNLSIENIRSLESFFLDSDGLDFEIISNREIRFGKEGLHTSSLPVKRLLQYLNKNAGEYKRRGEQLRLCIISPNFEGMKYNGFNEKLSSMEFENIEPHIGFICLRIGDYESMAEDRLFEYPKGVIRERKQNKYSEYILKVANSLRTKMFIDLSKDLGNLVPNSNASTQLFAYVKKKPRRTAYTPKDVMQAFIEQSRQFESICKEKTYEQIVEYLSARNFLSYSLTISRKPGESEHCKTLKAEKLKDSSFTESEIRTVLTNILGSEE